MNFLEKSHTGRNQWYFYILTLLIVFTATQIGTLPLAGYIYFLNPSPTPTTQDIAQATSTNLGLALTLLSFAFGFAALLLCVKYIHKKHLLEIVTGRDRLDWGRIFFGAGIWAILSILTFLLPLLFGESDTLVFQFDASKFFVLLLISLILFPFQTSFEELTFRGYLMQGSYLLFNNKWAALVLTSVIFGLMHSANPEVEAFGAWVALPQYIIMGFLLGYVAIKDNGMELSLGIHVANNILSAITFTSDSSTLQTHALFRDLAPSSSWMDSVVILIAALVFVWICNRKYKFMTKKESIC